MKKLLCLLMALMLMLSFTACNNIPSNGPVMEDTAEDNDSAKDNNDEELEEKSKSSKPKKAVDFEEITVMDDDLVIKITDVVPNDSMGYKICTYLENNTDTSCTFSIDYATANGLAVDPSLYEQVEPGKKSNKDVYIYDSDTSLTFAGLSFDDITDLELAFKVTDDNYDEIAYEVTNIYPYGEDEATQLSRKDKNDDIFTLDKNDLKFVVTDIVEGDEYYNYYAIVYLENNTDEIVYFTDDDASVNGYMCDPTFGAYVPAGACRYARMYWSETTFEENDISKVDEIEMTVKAYDQGYDYIIEEAVTFEP